ncbi:hypothetical protein ABZ297_14710 [Nonomuraea sp. NPDC005983]|uniref:hypothetical protein n=1 Tax=Nonomuraea sp. NPDC005983 TaxID=3155595 RepID=UPI0033A7A3A4
MATSTPSLSPPAEGGEEVSGAGSAEFGLGSRLEGRHGPGGQAGVCGHGLSAEEEGLGLPVEGLGIPLGDWLGDGEGLSEPLSDGLGLGDGEEVSDGLGDGEEVSDGLGDGEELSDGLPDKSGYVGSVEAGPGTRYTFRLFGGDGPQRE